MKHILQSMLTATAAVAILASGAIAEDAPRKGGTLVTVLGSNVRNLNPAVQSGIVTGYPGAQLFAAPLRYDEDWTPQPYLAKSWDVSEDGLTVTLNLVQNAVFHDGAPITSEDVAFSVETIKAHHPFKSMFAPVRNVSILVHPCRPFEPNHSVLTNSLLLDIVLGSCFARSIPHTPELLNESLQLRPS